MIYHLVKSLELVEGEEEKSDTCIKAGEYHKGTAFHFTLTIDM